MREILFRGKAIDGNWYYGVPLVFTEDYVCMTAPHTHNKKVEANTIGQFTGLTDKNGNKIFEGDIVSHFINYLGQRVHASVEYDNELASWMCNYTFENKKGSAFLCDWVDGNGAEIIGNEWDNPELLKGDKSDA